MSLIQLAYASAAVNPFSPADLRELLTKARANNSAGGITGLLLYRSQSFFQILEGREGDVDPLFGRIGRDRRHDRVLLLSKKNVEARNFGNWSMGFVDAEQKAGSLPGFVKLLESKASFLDLQGDSALVAKLIDGFQEGRWRQGVE